MIIILRTFLFVASLALFGALTDLLAQGVGRRMNRSPAALMLSARMAPKYFLLGAAVYAFLASLLSMCGVMLSLKVFLAQAALLAGLLMISEGTGVFARVKFTYAVFDRQRSSRESIMIYVLFAAVGLFCILKLINHLAFPSFNIDLLGHLLSKSKILLHETYASSLYFHDPLFANLHSNYPPLFAVVYNLLFLFVGGPINSAYQAVNTLLLFFLAWSVWEFLAGRMPPERAACWSLIMISAKIYAEPIMDGADLFLSLFFLAMAVEAYRYMDTDDPYHALTAAVLAAGAALLKNEALTALVIIFGFMIIEKCVGLSLRAPKGRSNLKREVASLPTENIRAPRNDKVGYMVVALVLGFIVPWTLFRLGLPTPDETHEHLLIQKAGLFSGQQFLATVAVFFKLMRSNYWSGAFLLFALAVVLQARNLARGRFALFPLFVVSQILVYGIVIGLSYGNNLSPHIAGVARLLAQVYPLAWVTVALAAENYIPR